MFLSLFSRTVTIFLPRPFLLYSGSTWTHSMLPSRQASSYSAIPEAAMIPPGAQIYTHRSSRNVSFSFHRRISSSPTEMPACRYEVRIISASSRV